LASTRIQQWFIKQARCLSIIMIRCVKISIERLSTVTNNPTISKEENAIKTR